MRSKLLILGMLVLLGGCSFAPHYTRPEMPIPGKWPEGVAYKSALAPSEMKIPELRRNMFFTDLKLKKVMDIALVNNRDLRLAALNVEKAQALYGVQRAEFFPSINATAGGGKQRFSSDLIKPGDPRTAESYSVNLGVASWEMDFFGRIRSLKDQALEEYLATDEARRSTQIALVAEVARAYLTLAADRENLKLARSTLADQQAAYGLIHRQYIVGVASELDLRRAQTQVDTAAVDAARYTQMTAQDCNALNLLAGAPVPEYLLPADLASVLPPREIFPGLKSEVLLNRPDIVAAEHQLKGAYAFIGAARSAFFPQISLTTSIGTASSDLSGLFDAGTGTWSFAPQIAMPVFDARTWAAYRVSKAQRKIAQAQYEKTIQVAFSEVADSLAVKGTIDRQLSAQQSLTNAVAYTCRLSSQRYEKGIDSYLSVLDAQRSLYAAQQGLISLRLVKLANQVNLYAVLGGGGD